MAKKGITANQITISAILLSFAYAALLCLNIKSLWLLLPVILFIRMGLNAIDGMLARDYNMKSKLGMALNELGDIASDTALFIPFMFYAPNASWEIAAFIFVAAMTETCGILAYMISGERRYDGPMGKSDRAFATGTIGFLIGTGYMTVRILPWIFLFLCALAFWACFNRVKEAIQKENENDENKVST